MPERTGVNNVTHLLVRHPQISGGKLLLHRVSLVEAALLESFGVSLVLNNDRGKQALAWCKDGKLFSN